MINPLNQEKGWLSASFEKDEWIRELKKAEVRDLKGIVTKYFNGTLAPAILINDKLCDGFGRCIFYHAIGKDILVAKFYSK